MKRRYFIKIKVVDSWVSGDALDDSLQFCYFTLEDANTAAESLKNRGYEVRIDQDWLHY